MRGQSYSQRRESIREHLLRTYPKLTAEQLARQEGVNVSTVRSIMRDLNIDARLYTKRVRRSWKRLALIADLQELEDLIKSPITKEQ